ncbi:EF hand [compost metagenome]
MVARRLLDRADRDGDGYLSLEEFQALLKDPQLPDLLGAGWQFLQHANNVPGLFAMYDRDGDGKLSATDLRGLAVPSLEDTLEAGRINERPRG